MVYKLSHCDKSYQQLLQSEVGNVDFECLQVSPQLGQIHYNTIIKMVSTKFTLITRFSFKVCKIHDCLWLPSSIHVFSMSLMSRHDFELIYYVIDILNMNSN